MKRSALASGHSLVRKTAIAAGIAFAISAIANPAMAASAANNSDSFRIAPEDVKANQTALGVSDPSFRNLDGNWGRSSGVTQKVEIAIPSINPVDVMAMSSGYGQRRSPMRGASRNHKGLDIRGAVGTPIYATANAIVGRAQWVRGYGKYVELEHGNSIETRYGHMSALNVVAGQRVRKGDIIGYMGSTGRSTGSHLHYEVRIGGEAVNPSSFLSTIAAQPAFVLAQPANQLIAGKQVVTTASSGAGN
jgi:murein DD-endopeptidase MepM/ murein hydrolase activator NlpD